MKKWNQQITDRIHELYDDHTWEEIAKVLKKEFKFTRHPDNIRKMFKNRTSSATRKPHGHNTANKKPKILVFDIETCPMES